MRTICFDEMDALPNIARKLKKGILEDETFSIFPKQFRYVILYKGDLMDAIGDISKGIVSNPSFDLYEIKKERLK